MAKDRNKKRCDLGNAVTLEQDCKWRKLSGKYARGFAEGAENEFGPLAQMKARCLSMGSICRSVTCKTDGNCRTSGTSTMSPSTSGEVTYVPESGSTNWHVCYKAANARKKAFLASGEWVKGKEGQDCNEVCQTIGKKCSVTELNELTNYHWLKEAFEEAGYTCKGRHGAEAYAGVPFSTGRRDDCGPLKGSGSASCTGNRFVGHALLCNCKDAVAKKGCEDHTFKKKGKWHDSDGSKYDCQWYSKGGWCKKYGDGYENEGLTANKACCGCGGGWTPITTTTTTTTTSTTTLTGATYDYAQGRSDRCVRVQGTGQNLSAVEFSFKVKKFGHDGWAIPSFGWPLWASNWPGPIDAWIAAQSFDAASDKWHLVFVIWLPLQNYFQEKVEFSTPFEFYQEYDVKILYSAELDNIKLFVHGEEKEDQKFTTPLCWMEVGSSVLGCDSNRDLTFQGSVKSFKIGPPKDLVDMGH